MSPWKRIYYWLAGGIGLFLILLAALLFLLPRLIDRDWSRGKIERTASALVGGTVEVHGSDLHYWPHPRMRIRGARVDIPGTATGTIRSLVVYPRIVPLLWGKVRASELHIEAPAFTVTIPEKPSSETEKEEDVPALVSLEEKLRSVLSFPSIPSPTQIGLERITTPWTDLKGSYTKIWRTDPGGAGRFRLIFLYRDHLHKP